MKLSSLLHLPGHGGKVVVSISSPRDGRLYVTAALDHIAVSVGLGEREVRDLAKLCAAYLERQAPAAAQLDPAGLCLCGHRRGIHVQLEGPCEMDRACGCRVMRPVSIVSVVQSCTVAGGAPV